VEAEEPEQAWPPPVVLGFRARRSASAEHRASPAWRARLEVYDRRRPRVCEAMPARPRVGTESACGPIGATGPRYTSLRFDARIVPPGGAWLALPQNSWSAAAKSSIRGGRLIPAPGS